MDFCVRGSHRRSNLLALMRWCVRASEGASLSVKRKQEICFSFLFLIVGCARNYDVGVDVGTAEK